LVDQAAPGEIGEEVHGGRSQRSGVTGQEPTASETDRIDPWFDAKQAEWCRGGGC
jgi:hypothetical protein